MKLGKSQRDKEPRRVASVAAYNAEGLLLFGKRQDSGKWTMPGGHLEPGEEPMEAARRELEEEAGLVGQDFIYLGRGLGGPKNDIIIYSFKCRVEGDPSAEKDPDEEIDDWKWVEPHDMPEEVSTKLHSPKNVTLRLLGLQDGEVEEPMAKADPHFVERNPYSGKGIKIPKYGTRTRKKWDAQFLQDLAAGFAGGDVTRLRPVQIPTDQSMGSNMAVNKSRLNLYKRMLKSKDRLPPVVVKRVGLGYHLLDGNHRLEAARQAGHALIHAVEVQDPPLKKGLPGLALVGALAMGGAGKPAPATPAPQPIHQIAQAQGMPQWTPDSLHPDLHPIAHLESSWGQNMAHSSHSKGDFHTAYGALGFKPVTAHEEYQKSKFMQGQYPDLSSPENFLPRFKNDSKFYNLLASAHFARLKHRHGGPQQAAFAWRWGSGACAKATPEQITNDGYVQKYTHMNLHGKQGQETIQKADVIQGHDYHPDQDYEPDEAPDSEVQDAVQHVLPRLHAAAKDMNLGVPQIHYVKGLGESHLARYVNGTHSAPVIVVDAAAHRDAADADGVHLHDALHGTLFHELGHAYLDSAGTSTHDDKEEDLVERFAHASWQTGDHRRAMKMLAPRSPRGLQKEEDTDFNFGANVDPDRDLLHRKALKSIARMHPENQKVAHAWIAFTKGKADRPVIHPDLERHLARFGIVDPKGFPYNEAGRSLEKPIGGPKVSVQANGRRVEQPEGLRRYRGLDRDYFMPYQRSEEGDDDLFKTEHHDPLEAMLAHDDPRERVMALRSKLCTPYHLRLAMQDEDPDVRAAAAKHPMMTSSLIEEALKHPDLHTREAALSRPDLQEHHLEQAIWDPDLQTQAAMHPALTEDQRQKLVGAVDTPEGLRTELLHKSIGYLTYPKLGQPKSYSEPMVRSPEAHDKLREKKNSIGTQGFVSYNRFRNKKMPDDKRRFSASVNANTSSIPAAVGHETQHGVFARLRQEYGNEAGHRIVATTLQALDPADHKHLKALTDWRVQNRYNPIQEPEERIAYLQNYLQDGLWRKSAHKHMRIHMDPNAQKVAHDWAKQIWQKLRLRAEALGPEHVGVFKTEPDIKAWVLSKGDPDMDYNVYEDLLGLTPRSEAFLEAAKFMGHTAPDEALFRQCLLADKDLIESALISVGLEPTEANRKGLQSVLKLQGAGLKKAGKTHEVIALMPDGQEVAEQVLRGFGASTEQELHLGGRHSSGAMMVRDPDSGQMYLLKPGSGGQSPAKGAREERSNQSRREAAFWHVAEAWGLNQRVPRADLLLIDGKEVAVLHLLPFDWKNLEKLKFKDAGLPHKALEKYRQMGELHKWAIMDYVLGNPDRHGQNLMVGSQKEGYPVALIDHGSAFAGSHFDPANDKNSFIPYYLRAWKAEGWNQLTPEQRLRAMPSVNGDTDQQLREWFHGINASDLEQVLHRYGIDPAPSTARLAKVKALLAEDNFSEAVNRIWLAT